MRHNFTALLALPILAAGCGSDGDAVPPAPEIALEHLAESAPLPLSAFEELVVLSENRACVLGSYEVRIVCGDRQWGANVYLGREGRGPGELLLPGPLMRMPDGGLAYADLRNGRITLFTAGLAFSGHIRLPSQGSPLEPITADSLLFIAERGFVFDPANAERPQITKREPRILAFDLASAAVTESLPLVIDYEKLGHDIVMASPIARDSARILLRATGNYLLWLEKSTGEIIGVIPPPTFDPGYPDTLDMEDIRADLRAIFGVLLEADVERQRSLRRHHYPRGNIAQVDGAGRLWVLTNRRGEPNTTYIDVYDRTQFLGAMALPGRVVAFRMLDSLLVAMNDDVEGNEQGTRARRLNWYRIRQQ